MRLLFLIAVSACLLMAAPQEKEPAAQEPASLPPPRITRSNGVVTIRGTTAQAPRLEPKAEEAPAAEASEAKAAEPKKPEPPKPPRRVSSATATLDPNGRQQRSGRQVVVERNNGVTSTTDTIRNSNGRRVPYISEEKREISSGAGGGPRITEERTQRYDTAGNPSQQELVRTEERKLPGGVVERTQVLYRENLNGRMEPVERSVEVVKESGPVTTTTKRVETPSVNGRFETILREESTERREGENKATMETVRSASFGGRMQVVAREESTMVKTGSVAKTETEVYERQPGSGEIELARRSVGTLEEREDGSTVEKVETYGFRTAGGARNVNATRPALQEVVERRKTVQADGSVRERESVRGLSPSAPGQMGAPTVTETVITPTAGGEQVRTNVYEQGVNGRMRATQSTVQQIAK